MADQDLKKCNTPEAVLIVLLSAASDFSADAQNLDASGQDGKPWHIIGDELDKAVDRMHRRIKKAGYPLRDLKPAVEQPTDTWDRDADHVDGYDRDDLG